MQTDLSQTSDYWLLKHTIKYILDLNYFIISLLNRILKEFVQNQNCLYGGIEPLNAASGEVI